MTTMTRGVARLALLGTLALAACQDDATGPKGFATEELDAALTITPDHFHIYETEGEFSVAVTDPSGAAVTDFEVLRLERRLVGATSWSGLELTREGDLYVGRDTFEASGSYELRVTGLREADEELVVLYSAAEPLGVVRAHADVGGRRLELENFPGHIHAGDESAMTFWVMETQRNPQGVRPPVPGLAPTIWVEVNGTRTSYAATESQPGVYAATHRFTAVGAALVGIGFQGTDGQHHEWSVEIDVHQPH
jgi:hypothetical protein